MKEWVMVFRYDDHVAQLPAAPIYPKTKKLKILKPLMVFLLKTFSGYNIK